jgi:hypothetical protein
MIALITDYHGGPVTTEYMLTSDIARELIHQNHEVHVEYLNRRMVNGMTMRRSGPPVPKFGSRRTDVAVLRDQIIPRAIVEVKTDADKTSPAGRALAARRRTSRSCAGRHRRGGYLELGDGRLT